ncbi:mRNA turnover protein 4 homolog [Neoarius graeffei]|uniref:mRNA turnover protein 4 homolog n=1 Tax=Neoarius graeffei TaxID=443677 RepID=UPI00298D3C02|nr:mRNA turnover protein 4 homolog [Neoarius graeffei]
MCSSNWMPNRQLQIALARVTTVKFALHTNQKLFGIEMAEFKVTVKCMWNSETGDFTLLVEGDEEAEQEKDNDDTTSS